VLTTLTIYYTFTYCTFTYCTFTFTKNVIFYFVSMKLS
jgi:hypothetical protein